MVLIILMAVDITTLLPALSDCKEMDLNGYEDCEHYREVTTIANIIGLVIALALNIYFWFLLSFTTFTKFLSGAKEK